MACRGVHFALRPDEQQQLLEAVDDAALVALLQEEIEERWDQEWLFESDKAWDAIHRCLGKGDLSSDGSTLSKCILGGRQLHEGDGYIVSYLTADEVASVSIALDKVDESWVRRRYSSIAKHGYDGPVGDDDFEYTWDNLQGLRAFFRKAAEARRTVVFFVDQ